MLKKPALWRWFSLVLPLLTVATRVIWLLRFPAEPIGPVDAEGFHLLAVNVLTGRGFAIAWEPPFCPTAIRPPLYPFFVAGGYSLLGLDPARIVLLQVLLEALTTALVIRLGREVGHRCGGHALALSVGALSGLCYALNGSTQRYTGYLLAEALLLPLMSAALWATLCCLQRPTVRRAGLAGLLWGAALLTKPNIQFWVLAVGGLLGVRAVAPRWGRSLPVGAVPPRWGSLLAFWGALAAVLSPWVARNCVTLGRCMISDAFEENLTRVSAVATMAELQGVRAEPWTDTWEYLYGQIVSSAAVRYGWAYLGDERTCHAGFPACCAEQSLRHRQMAVVAREIVRAHPCAFVRSHLRGVGRALLDLGHRLWYRVLTGQEWETTGVVGTIWPRLAWSLERGAVGDALHALWLERVQRPPLAAGLVWWGLLLARLGVWGLGLRGTWRLRAQPLACLVLAGTVAYVLLLPGPIAYDRFYLPAIPAVAVLVALGSMSYFLNVSGD